MEDNGIRRNKYGGYFNINDYMNKAIRKSYINQNTVVKTIKDDTFYGVDKRHKYIVDRKTGITTGQLDYVVENGKPRVEMIFINPEYRRKGYGTILMKNLQKDFSNQEINFGILTPQYGEPFIKSIANITNEALGKTGTKYYKGKIKE